MILIKKKFNIQTHVGNFQFDSHIVICLFNRLRMKVDYDYEWKEVVVNLILILIWNPSWKILT